MSKDKKSDDKENIDKEPPLQEIIPDDIKEKRKREEEAAIRKHILDKMKDKTAGENKNERKNRKKKINKSRKHQGGRL